MQVSAAAGSAAPKALAAPESMCQPSVVQWGPPGRGAAALRGVQGWGQQHWAAAGPYSPAAGAAKQLGLPCCNRTTSSPMGTTTASTCMQEQWCCKNEAHHRLPGAPAKAVMPAECMCNLRPALFFSCCLRQVKKERVTDHGRSASLVGGAHSRGHTRGRHFATLTHLVYVGIISCDAHSQLVLAPPRQ